MVEFPRPISSVLAEKLDLKLDITDDAPKTRPFTGRDSDTQLQLVRTASIGLLETEFLQNRIFKEIFSIL